MYSKEQVIKIVAEFARTYNTETFLDNGETLEEAIEEVKDLINWDVVEASFQNSVSSWVKVSNRLPEFGKTVLVYCKIYGRFLATYEFIGEFQNCKYGNWKDFNGNLGILPPLYWLQIPEPPCL